MAAVRSRRRSTTPRARPRAKPKVVDKAVVCEVVVEPPKPPEPITPPQPVPRYLTASETPGRYEFVGNFGRFDVYAKFKTDWSAGSHLQVRCNRIMAQSYPLPAWHLYEYIDDKNVENPPITSWENAALDATELLFKQGKLNVGYDISITDGRPTLPERKRLYIPPSLDMPTPEEVTRFEKLLSLMPMHACNFEQRGVGTVVIDRECKTARLYQACDIYGDKECQKLRLILEALDFKAELPA